MDLNDLNRQVFEVLDKDDSGTIDLADLEEIGKAMGWKKQEGKFSMDNINSGGLAVSTGPKS